MDLRPVNQQIRQLQERIELLHVNLQTVSSRTLCNSSTYSFEDRVTPLEEDQVLPEPPITSDILEDISRQMAIFDQQLQTLENKVKDCLHNLDKKVTDCNLKLDTYQTEYYEWMEQRWKEGEADTHRNLGTTLANQQAQVQTILEILQQHGLAPLPKDRKDKSKPDLVHFPKMETEITTTQETSRLFTSTSPKRRCWRIEVLDIIRIPLEKTNQSHAQNSVALPAHHRHFRFSVSFVAAADSHHDSHSLWRWQNFPWPFGSSARTCQLNPFLWYSRRNTRRSTQGSGFPFITYAQNGPQCCWTYRQQPAQPPLPTHSSADLRTPWWIPRRIRRQTAGHRLDLSTSSGSTHSIGRMWQTSWTSWLLSSTHYLRREIFPRSRSAPPQHYIAKE